MMRSIPRHEWRPFLDEFGREHRGWLATVERAGLIQAREQPLESIRAGEEIEIRIGGQSIRVAEPRAVSVDETADGAAQALHIEEPNGAAVRVHFRVAIAPGALDGLAPAER